MADDQRFDIQEYVYEGVWKNYRDPAFRRWTWTLSDSKALLSLACLSILVAFAQTRMWVIARYIIYQRSKSPRLPDSEGVDPRLTLSQGAAIAETLPSIKMAVARAVRQRWRFTPGRREEGDDSSTQDLSVSPLFGVAAMINIMVFISMGVVIPWALSNGSLETPIVKSRVTEQCLEAKRINMISDFSADLFQADAILQQCRNRLNDTCDNRYYLQQPKVTTRRIHECPFLGDSVCIRDEMTVEITHEDISAYEAGVNSPTTITMNHRLRCAPLLLDRFTLYRTRDVTSNSTTDYADAPIYTSPGGKRIALVGAVITVKPKGKISGSFSMDLHTLNGPHKVSNESSGLNLAEKRIQSDVTVLPKAFAEFEAEDLLPELRLQDALPFLVVYRAGAAQFNSPVDDPFFSAHNLNKNDNITYYADREATALGCAEQFQFCRSNQKYCTAWGRGSSMAYRLFNSSDSSSRPNDDEIADIVALFRMLPAGFSIYDYLALHVAFPRAMTGAFPLIAPINLWDTNSWDLQVKTWFTKAMLNAILYIRFGVKAPLDRDSQRFSREWKKKSALCGRVLFQHPGYTNINWVGAWCTIGALLLICVGSYTMHLIPRVPGKALSAFRRLVPLLRPLIFLQSSRRVLESLEAGWNNIDLSDLSTEIAVEPVNPEHEDIDAVIPGLARASTF